MSEDAHKCPICRGVFGGIAVDQTSFGFDGKEIDCPACGQFSISGSAVQKIANNERFGTLQPLASYLIRNRIGTNADGFVDSEFIESVLNGEFALPIPTEQVRAIIRYIGDHERQNGQPYPKPDARFYATVGAANPSQASRLVLDLSKSNMVEAIDSTDLVEADFLNARLTLAGWERWEELRKGMEAGDHGFLAMQFGDPKHDTFIDAHVREPLRNKNLPVYRLDDRTVARAGIIDNLMRDHIRNAAFVIVDLSHGNKGAYWEAGFAEGLGKPVVYIGEKASLFGEGVGRAHFDVNHCTIVMWTKGEEENFSKSLIATVRNSLAVQKNRP